MNPVRARAPGTPLLAAVVLSACIGVIGGGLGAWGVYTHFGPVQRVVTETKNGGGSISVGDIANAVQSSLVTVSTQPVTAGALAAGSFAGLAEGFAVSGDGLILTSAAAVRGATRLRVAGADGRAYDATIAASDVADGLVVLRAAGATGMTPLHLAPQDVHIGDLGFVVFHPPLGTLSTRSGIIAAVGMNASTGPSELADLIAVDSTSAPDAEGAPLVDGTGAVIGVVTTVTLAPGVIAASGRDAAALLNGIGRGSRTSAATFGVTGVLVTPSVAAATGLPQGALVRSVATAGPAAGLLQTGDVVTSVNGTAVASAGGIDPADFGLTAGDRAVLLVIAPGGAARSVTLIIADG